MMSKIKIKHYIKGVEVTSEEVYDSLFRYIKETKQYKEFLDLLKTINDATKLRDLGYLYSDKYGHIQECIEKKTDIMGLLRVIIDMRSTHLISDWLSNYTNSFIEYKTDKFYDFLVVADNGELHDEFIKEFEKQANRAECYRDAKTVVEALKRVAIFWLNRMDFFNLMLRWEETAQGYNFWYEKHNKFHECYHEVTYFRKDETFCIN